MRRQLSVLAYCLAHVLLQCCSASRAHLHADQHVCMYNKLQVPELHQHAYKVRQVSSGWQLEPVATDAGSISARGCRGLGWIGGLCGWARCCSCCGSCWRWGHTSRQQGRQETWRPAVAVGAQPVCRRAEPHAKGTGASCSTCRSQGVSTGSGTNCGASGSCFVSTSTYALGGSCSAGSCCTSRHSSSSSSCVRE